MKSQFSIFQKSHRERIKKMERQRTILNIIAFAIMIVISISLSVISYLVIMHIASPDFTGLKSIFDYLWNGNK